MFKKRNLAFFMAALMSVVFLAGGVCEDVKAGSIDGLYSAVRSVFNDLDGNDVNHLLSGHLKVLSSYITENNLSEKIDLEGVVDHPISRDSIDTYGLDKMVGEIIKDVTDSTQEYAFNKITTNDLSFSVDNAIDFGEYLNVAANGLDCDNAEFIIEPYRDFIPSLDESNYKRVEYFNAFIENTASVSGPYFIYFPMKIKLNISNDVDITKVKLYHFTASPLEGGKDIISEVPFTVNGDGTITMMIYKSIDNLDSSVIAEANISNSDIMLCSAGDDNNDYYALVELKDASQDDPSDEPDDDPQDDPIFNPPTWIPQTPEEIKRFACLGSEKLEYSCSERNPYGIIFVKSVQGPKCFASFEAVLGDYTIGRTYSAYVNGRLIYSMPQKARVTLVIPETLRKEGRVFKMICVTKDGRPIIYNDLDKDPDTITFDTNKFYAYALIYK